MYARLKKTWGRFINDWWSRIEVGEKIAEGGQAEIFNVPCSVATRTVAKVMKKGFRLRDLEKQWPLGLLRNRGGTGAHLTSNICVIHGAVLLENGRFAFHMRKYWGDLRKLIDMRMLLNYNQRPPFENEKVGYIVVKIAVGMGQLHAQKIVHRDLKASNVLIKFFDEEKADLKELNFSCVHVADFECSVGVVARDIGELRRF